MSLSNSELDVNELEVKTVDAGRSTTLASETSSSQLVQDLYLKLVQPSSAQQSGFFSILTNSFSSQQESSLEDYIQLSVMLQYNHRS